MLEALQGWLDERLGVEVVGVDPVAGGCIHRAWCLTLADGSRLFAKTNDREALPLLEAEAEGLAALASFTDPAVLMVPAPLAAGTAGALAVLVLPWLELGGGGSPGDARSGGWRGLGAALADLHRNSSLTCASDGGGTGAGPYGWSRDNFIGAFPQTNGWLGGWGRFFGERRLRPQLEALAARGRALPCAMALLEAVPSWLAGHEPPAALVHGDLWSGNAALLADGRGALFDPAVHRADREVDLAMAQLFGGFPEAFFDGYAQRWPLPEGHSDRVALYNLYHLLNHANLFDGSYHHRAGATIEALLQKPPGRRKSAGGW